MVSARDLSPCAGRVARSRMRRKPAGVRLIMGQPGPSCGQAGFLKVAMAPAPRPVMGWSGRAPAAPASQAGTGHDRRSTAMCNKSNATIATIGIDIGKNSFHVVGLDQRGAIVLR